MNSYIFGFNVYSRPIEEMLVYAKENNLKHIEIHPSNVHSSIESFTDQRIKNILNYTSKNDTSISLHIPHSINISDIILPIRRNHTKKLVQYLTLAKKLKSYCITLHIGNFYWFPVEIKKRHSALKRFSKQIKPLLNFCEENNIILALENSVKIPAGSEYLFLGDNVEDFNFLFSKLNSDYLGMCLDTGHANVSEGIEEYLKLFGEKIKIIHFHDNNKTNDEHLPIGQGNIDWNYFSEKIKEINFNGPFISECREELPHESAASLNKIL